METFLHFLVLAATSFVCGVCFMGGILFYIYIDQKYVEKWRKRRKLKRILREREKAK